MVQKTHLGIYAIILKNNHILLIKKSRGPYKDLLDLPGGRPEHGETTEQTLIREVKEETGIAVLDFCLFDNYNHCFTYNNGKEDVSFYHIGLIYLVKSFNDEYIGKILEGEDSEGIVWFDLKDNLEKLSPFARNTYLKLKG